MSRVTTVEMLAIGEMLVLISMSLMFSANMDLAGLSRPLRTRLHVRKQGVLEPQSAVPCMIWHLVETPLRVPKQCRRIIYPSSALHGITAWEKKFRAYFLKKKLGM